MKKVYVVHYEDFFTNEIKIFSAKKRASEYFDGLAKKYDCTVHKLLDVGDIVLDVRRNEYEEPEEKVELTLTVEMVH